MSSQPWKISSTALIVALGFLLGVSAKVEASSPDSESVFGQRGPEAELCFLEIGPPGSSISAADRANLETAISKANAATHAPRFPRPQPSPRLYVYGSYVDEPLMMKAGQNTYNSATNHLYSVAALTDSTGAVVERYKYDTGGFRPAILPRCAQFAQ